MNAQVDMGNNDNNNAQSNDPELGTKHNEGIANYIKHAGHPGVCIVTILFKLSSITCFILLSILVDSTALVYLVVILLASFDFWVTKNVAGRRLVGLRWWNEVKDDGTEVWIYESKNEVKEANADSRIFWTCTYASAIAWAIIFIWDIISFKWIWAIIAFICFLFAGTNLYGFFKCSKQQQSNLTDLGTNAAKKALEKGTEYAIKNQGK
jgi:hypothetical protein